MLSTEISDLTELLESWQAASRQKLAGLGIVALMEIPDPASNPPKSKAEAKPKSTKTKAKNKTADTSGNGGGNIPLNQLANSPVPQTQAQPGHVAIDRTKVKYRVEILDDDELLADLDVASGMELFLATLAGKSKETVRTYRTGCRRFLTFLYTTGRGQPTHIPVNKLPISILERYHDWLLSQYIGDNSSKSCPYPISGRISVNWIRLIRRLNFLFGHGRGG